MGIDDQDRYEQLGKAWRHVVSWRDKLFAGYLTVLGALGYVILQDATAVRRLALFGAGVMLSAIFWIFEFRTRNIVNACQATAASLEADRGLYTTMIRLRKKSKRWQTYGFGMSLLTAGAIGICLAGLMRYLPATLQVRPLPILISMVLPGLVAVALMILFECPGSKQRKAELEDPLVDRAK